MSSGTSSGSSGGGITAAVVRSIAATVVRNTVGNWVVKAGITIGSFVVWAVYTPIDIWGDAVTTITSSVRSGVFPAIDAVGSALDGIVAGALPNGGQTVLAPLIVWVIWLALAAVVVYVIGQIITLLDPR
ncbi:hypothetical protein [Halobaculum sp. P14]|uniref:hypothetical protein n=1 Tax=Halobaculum sp. P14 TaxID=3421638 RepID=UPI003EBE0C3B